MKRWKQNTIISLYDTSLQVEDFIASKVSKYYDLIEKIDSRVLEGKIKK